MRPLGRAVRYGSTPFLFLCAFGPAMPERTSADGMWSFTASAWSCGGCVRGIPMTLNLPMADFLGVALRVIRQDEAETVSLTLEHPDPGLSITLYRSGDTDDVVAEWQSWAQTLQRPLLVADDSGALHELFARLGPLRLGAVASRRRRRTAMKGRRPSIGWRRRQSLSSGTVHRGEREITRGN